MTALLADIPAAVVTAMNDSQGSFGQSFTAARVLYVEQKLSYFQDLRVSVMPGPFELSILDRSKRDTQVSVDVVIQKQVDPAVNAECDPLLELFEQVLMFLLGRQLTTAGNRRIQCMEASPIGPESAAINPDLVRNLRLFTAILRARFVVRGEG